MSPRTSHLPRTAGAAAAERGVWCLSSCDFFFFFFLVFSCSSGFLCLSEKKGVPLCRMCACVRRWRQQQQRNQTERKLSLFTSPDPTFSSCEVFSFFLFPNTSNHPRRKGAFENWITFLAHLTTEHFFFCIFFSFFFTEPGTRNPCHPWTSWGAGPGGCWGGHHPGRW